MVKKKKSKLLRNNNNNSNSISNKEALVMIWKGPMRIAVLAQAHAKGVEIKVQVSKGAITTRKERSLVWKGRRRVIQTMEM